jgi:Mlc titration factor MtfA (ptsG expression regulator)
MAQPANSITLPQVITLIGLTLLVYRLTYSSNIPYVKRNIKKYLFLRNLDKIYKPYLSANFAFYNSLDAKNKLLYERRVQKFIDLKEFIPRGGIKEITAEMKSLIAGSAIQLTFGYPEVYFRHFWRILIYPDSYYSTITRKYHNGEVNVKGIIVFSWKSFREGFANPSDGINLAYHEMAHALRLINIIDNEEYDFYDRRIMEEFEKEANSETIKILNSPHEKSLFRSYSATNLDEFFSVAIECFFEKPYDLVQYNPKLYSLLSKILKIDPYRLNSETFIRNTA